MSEPKAFISDATVAAIVFVSLANTWPASSPILVPSAKTLGSHDDEGAEPHVHYSVLYINDDGYVDDFDWGYHSVDEVVGTFPQFKKGGV